MRKAELRKSKVGDSVVIYRSLQERWEETADPEKEDLEYHLSYEEALEACNNISVNLDWNSLVDKITIAYEDILEIEFGKDFSLEDLCKGNVHNYRLQYDVEQVFCGDSNAGTCIEGAVIIQWSWEKYIGYARNFHSIRFGKTDEMEQDIFANGDSTMKTYESVLLDPKEAQDLEGQELLDAVNEALRTGDYKWNHFRNYPTDRKIISDLSIKIEEEIEDNE